MKKELNKLIEFYKVLATVGKMEQLQKILNNAELLELVIQLAIILGIIVSLILVVGISKKLVGRNVKDKKNRDRARMIINIIGILMLLSVFGTLSYRGNVGILAMVIFLFFIAGVFVIFRIKEFIVSISGWLSIVLSKTFETGDRISIGGVKGDVIDIGLTKTTIMEVGQWVNGDLYNGKIIKAPNSLVFGEPVHNYTASFPFVWDEITVPIRYGSDYRATKKLLEDIAEDVVAEYSLEAREYWDKMVKKYLIDDAKVDPVVTIEANDNWVEYTLRYVVDYKSRRGIKHELFMRLLDEVERESYNITLASATVEIVSDSSINVDIEK